MGERTCSWLHAEIRMKIAKKQKDENALTFFFSCAQTQALVLVSSVKLDPQLLSAAATKQDKCSTVMGLLPC